MALGRLDIPSVVLYNGTIYPGVYKGKRTATVVTVFEAIGAYRAGKISLEELYEVENAACPGAGACGGQFTANTMATIAEFLGPVARGPQRHPGRGPGEGRGGAQGRRAGDDAGPPRHPAVAVRHAASRSRTRSRRVAATGGSTNGVLHLLAIAHEYGHPARHRRVRRDRRPDAADRAT